MKGKLNLVTTVKKQKIPNTWQLCLGPSNFGWCSSGLRSTNPSGSNPSTLSLPFSSSKTVEEFEEIFGEWLFWWPLCTFKMSSLVLFFFFLNISLTGKPGRLCRLQNLCFTYEPVHFMVSSTNCRKYVKGGGSHCITKLTSRQLSPKRRSEERSRNKANVKVWEILLCEQARGFRVRLSIFTSNKSPASRSFWRASPLFVLQWRGLYRERSDKNIIYTSSCTFKYFRTLSGFT